MLWLHWTTCSKCRCHSRCKRSEHNWEGDRLKETFTWFVSMSSASQFRSWNSTWQSMWFAFVEWMRRFLILSNDHECIYVELEVPTIKTTCLKVDVTDWIPRLERTPMFERLMVGYGFKNGHHKDMCWKEIGLRAKNLLTILEATFNISGKNLYDHSMSTGIFTLTMNESFIRAPKMMRRVGTCTIRIC
jgi:hypothetical protein